MILNGVFGQLADDFRVGGLRNLLAKDDLTDLLRGVHAVDARVAVDFHLQLYHATQIGRNHQVRAILLGKLGGTGGIDAALHQFGDILAEVFLQHALGIVQIVQVQTAQYAGIDGHGSHHMLDEHVGLVAVFPPAGVCRIVVAVILTTADGFTVVDGEFGFLVSQFLQSVSAEDVHRRIVAKLGVDDQPIRFLGSFETGNVDDGLRGKTTVVHHIAGSVIGISQTLQLDLFVRVGSRKPIVTVISSSIRKVIGTGREKRYAKYKI